MIAANGQDLMPRTVNFIMGSFRLDDIAHTL